MQFLAKKSENRISFNLLGLVARNKFLVVLIAKLLANFRVVMQLFSLAQAFEVLQLKT